MTTHKIKLSHYFFDDVAGGRKNFELCKNDRHYQVGDCLCLCEVKEKCLTGRKLMVAVTYKLQDFTGLSVEYVNSDGTFLISELNYAGVQNKVHYRVCSPASYYTFAIKK